MNNVAGNTHLVITLGGATDAVKFAIEKHAPDQVHFIVSERSKPNLQRIDVSSLKTNADDPIVVEANDPTQVNERTRTLLRGH